MDGFLILLHLFSSNDIYIITTVFLGILIDPSRRPLLQYNLS